MSSTVGTEHTKALASQLLSAWRGRGEGRGGERWRGGGRGGEEEEEGRGEEVRGGRGGDGRSGEKRRGEGREGEGRHQLVSIRSSALEPNRAGCESCCVTSVKSLHLSEPLQLRLESRANGGPYFAGLLEDSMSSEVHGVYSSSPSASFIIIWMQEKELHMWVQKPRYPSA